jgi:SAM-dependent methyltransferase
MSLICDLCRHECAPAYTPEGGARGLTVHVCPHCGLVQSGPRIARTGDRHAAAVSGGADWGNLRYGKGFRTKAALEALARHSDFAAPLRLLDVGSNRGSFARAFLDRAPGAHVTAVEPDERHADSVAGLPATRLIQARIEETDLADGAFDIVHSCHTIEHLAEPLAALKDHWRVLKPGGLLLIDAPNIALIGGEDIAEEWFIDKHLFHFSEATLGAMLAAAGFDTIQANDRHDAVNLLFVARKGAARDPRVPQGEAVRALDLLRRYRQTRAANLAALKEVAARLVALAPRGIALWGAGRLFDLLVREGGFDPRALSLLIDGNLKTHMRERHGIALAGPEALDGTPVHAVIVMSRMFAGEIAAEVKRRAPAADIILYTDLLGQARLGRAA